MGPASQTSQTSQTRTYASEWPIARIVSVNGSQAIAVLNRPTAYSSEEARADIGSLVKIETQRGATVGVVSALSIPAPTSTGGEELRIVELELVGEFLGLGAGNAVFKRGVSIFPSLGDAVVQANHDDLVKIFASGTRAFIEVGTLHQDSGIRVPLFINDLLAKHFAILGTTGSGKSCAVALVMKRLVERYDNAHIVIFDLHNEYSQAFVGKSEVISPERLNIPFWLLNFDELVEVLAPASMNRDFEVEILSQIIPQARKRYMAQFSANTGRGSTVRKHADISLIAQDTPLPFRMADVLMYLNDMVGKLDRSQPTIPFLRLKSRIEALVSDPRYAFMFGSYSVQDNMSEVLSQIFRVPSDGRPLTILDLSSVPSEILNVVMSAMFRLAFDLAFWSQGKIPITLVCEEAHRYAPAKGSAFEPTRRAMARIAKEGRKYGVSLCIVTQRPSELDPTVLSQCNTVLALRLTNQLDQEFVKSATSESGVALLDFLPVLGKAEAVVMGEGVPLPLRIRFDELDKASGLPNGQSAPFSEVWSQRAAELNDLDDIVASWRAQRRMDATVAAEPPPPEEELPPPPPPPQKPAYQTLPPLASSGLVRSAPAAAPPPPAAGPQLTPKPPGVGITLRPGSLLNSIRKT
jgi:uncharacterized protein